MTVKVSFNELLDEAKREPVEIDMPDGSPIVVEFPDGERVKKLRAAMLADDEDAAVLALFGDGQGKRLLKQFATAPGDVPGRLVRKVMEAFGMPTAMLPNSLTSSS